MEFEDILMEVGDWGKFQISLLMIFGASISLIAPLPGMAIVFMVMTPDHHCHYPDSYENPDDGTMKSVHYVSNTSCRMSVITSSFINGIYVNNTRETSCIYGWDYDKTYFDSTVTTKWNMVCQDDHYPALMMTLQIIGCLLGTPIYGALADRFGRKTVCFAMLFLSSVTDLGSVFVDNLLVFAVLRTINGTVLPTMFTLPYILISEFMAPNKRVVVNGLFNTTWMTGLCLLPLIAYVVRSWVFIGIVDATLCLLVMLHWKFVPESASWLISQGRYEEATKVMMNIGKKNNKLPNESQLFMKLKEFGEKNKHTKEEENNSFYSFIIKFPRLRKHFMIITFSWMSFSVAYLGLQFNVINLGGNIFLNFFLLSLAEFPGNIIFWIMMEKLGRRWSSAIGFLGISICCLLPLLGFEYSYIASSIIGKLIASGINMVVDQQACELFPTVARSLGVGTGKAISSIAMLCTPFLAYLSVYGRIIPFMVISIVTFMAAIMSSFLPETLNENLPQTFSDAEKVGQDQKYFSFNRKEKPKREVIISTIKLQESDGNYVTRL